MMTKNLFKMMEDELKGADKYQKYAESFREMGYPKDISLIFEKIAEMEMKHALWLKKIYEYLGGT